MPAEPGLHYSFRFTATDNVGNPASIETEAIAPHTITYYYFGGQRVAMRRVDDNGGDVVYYLHADHLGSASLATCGSADCGGGKGLGDEVSRQLYYPYG